jgi:hypothetical protein
MLLLLVSLFAGSGVIATHGDGSAASDYYFDVYCQSVCDEKFGSSSTSSSLFDWLIHTSGTASTKSKVLESVCWDEYKVTTQTTIIEFCGLELTNGLLHRRFLVTKKVHDRRRRRRRHNSNLVNENDDNHTTPYIQRRADNNSQSKTNADTTSETTLQHGFGTIDFLMNDGGCQCNHVEKEIIDDGDDVQEGTPRRNVETTTSILFPHLTSMWRAMEPEASFVLNQTQYVIGDWTTIPSNTSGFVNYRAFANRTNLAETIHAIPYGGKHRNTVFRYVGHDSVRTETLEPTLDWKPGTRYSDINSSWPPKGIRLSAHFRLRGTQEDKDENQHDDRRLPLAVTVHYELYDDIPVLSKWIEIKHDDEMTLVQGVDSDDNIDDNDWFAILRNVTTERLALYPPFGTYEFYHGSLHPYSFYNGVAGSSARPPPPQLLAFTDQAHGTICQWIDDIKNSNDTAVSDLTPYDMGANEPLLQCTYTIGPGIRLGTGAKDHMRFESFRTIMVATDSTEPERQSLMKHRMTQTLIPWVTENPIFFHGVIDEPPLAHNATEHFRSLIKQMDEVGFEMLVFSFDSSFELESTNSTYLDYIRGQVEYANSLGIEIGGYDLICLDRGHDGYGGNVGDEFDCVDPGSGHLTENACFASGWVDQLTEMVQNFLNHTGLTMLELDGPYGGGECASEDHDHHTGLEDSIYSQTQQQNKFIQKLRSQGVFINQPDTYFYQGGGKEAWGYDENQYSLPRWHQLTISRAGMYDDLFRLLPSQSWMLVPLSEYHAGGDAATFEGHLEELEWALAQYLGAGTAACYRGPVVFDASTVNKMLNDDRTRAIYKRWISFYKSHRRIIVQPVVHLRRPTLYTWDGWMHIDPNMRHNNEIGLAMVFNPTDRFLSKEVVRLPMYYTGAKVHEVLHVTLNDESSIVRVQGDHSVVVIFDMPPRTIHTIILRRDVDNLTVEYAID